MLGYAPRPDHKRLRPATLGLIILGYAGLLALVMTADPGKIFKEKSDPPDIIFVPVPKPPPPEPRANPQPSPSQITIVDPIVLPSPSPGPIIAELPQPHPNPGPVIGTGTLPQPIPFDPPIVRTGPRFATVGDAIRPPYPISKRESGDEASLRLKLSIDERGRVVAVDPVGRADPTFLEAARRHILRMWRYQPAMEGAKAMPSTTNITLRFELGNA